MSVSEDNSGELGFRVVGALSVENPMASNYAPSPHGHGELSGMEDFMNMLRLPMSNL